MHSQSSKADHLFPECGIQSDAKGQASLFQRGWLRKAPTLLSELCKVCRRCIVNNTAHPAS